MPVFNTGAILLESVRSILTQTLFAQMGADYWELLIVDDASTDVATREALNEAAATSPSVRVLPNIRSKGAAGARNTGVFAARGRWIGFLDSDDLWYPDFLRRQRDAFAEWPDAAWRAAHFDVGDVTARVQPAPLAQRSPCLHALIADDYAVQRVSRLPRPVDVLLRCGCLQAMTVQIDRDVIRGAGGFDESLPSAEDYDLWLRLASTQDLYVAPLDAGIYRLRDGSLTKSGRPMYYCEDRMLLGVRRERAFAAFRADIDDRLGRVYTKFCFHYRERRQFAEALVYAWRLMLLKPSKPDGWRQLAACLLRR